MLDNLGILNAIPIVGGTNALIKTGGDPNKLGSAVGSTVGVAAKSGVDIVGKGAGAGLGIGGGLLDFAGFGDITKNIKEYGIFILLCCICCVISAIAAYFAPMFLN